MTADERTCAEMAEGYAEAEINGFDTADMLAAIHPDLPDMPAATLRRYIALGQWVDDEGFAIWCTGAGGPFQLEVAEALTAALRSIGADE